MHHYRKTKITYSRHNEKDRQLKVQCSLCREIADRGHLVAEGIHMVIVRNRVAYEIFEGRKTTGEHLMILPRRHVESLAEFTDDEKLEMMTIAGEYEAKGFNVYARGVGSATRSQKHQHTHLIKLQDKHPKLMVYIAKPYLVAHID